MLNSFVACSGDTGDSAGAPVETSPFAAAVDAVKDQVDIQEGSPNGDVQIGHRSVDGDWRRIDATAVGHFAT